MDLDKDEQVCGTCKDWGGKREICGDAVCQVSPSARGLCAKLKKPKPPHGGCDNWTQLGGEDNA